MDTKPLEIEAESYIKHELLKYNFKVSKPDFDTEGADLLIVDGIKNKFIHFLKIQCKGRTIKNGSQIVIPTDYVKKNFVIFLYIKNESYDTSLFTFFYEDIIKWGVRNDNYILNFSANKIKSNDFLKNIFNQKTVEKIREKLRKTKLNNHRLKAGGFH